MRDVLNHPELRRSLALEKFLLVPNYDDFVEQKKHVEATVIKKDIRVLLSKKTLDTDNLNEFPIDMFKTNTGYVRHELSTGRLENLEEH